jgi:hypothetical protein
MCRKKNLLLISILSVVAVACLAGCSRRPHNGHGFRINPEPLARAAIEEFDTNKDGKIDRAELEKCPGLKAAAEKIDPRGTGEITAKMIAARIQTWLDTRLGRMSLSCRITHNGKPLEGAEVKFVPERFLGLDHPERWTASGKTDDKGNASISIPTNPNDRNDRPGVPPGFYRIDVTKPGIKIPAKYNTETTLGQEVALDAHGIKEGIQFDLDF